MATFVDVVNEIQSSVVALGFPRRPVTEGTSLTKESIDLVPAIVGTGFQAGVGKIATCAHVVQALTLHPTYGEARIITINKKPDILVADFTERTHPISTKGPT
jgi:hypothetical protein